MFEGQPKGLYALALANTGERFGYYTMLAIFTLFMQAKFGWSESQAGDVYAYFLAVVYFSPLVGGMLADKIGYGKCVVIGFNNHVCRISGLGNSHSSQTLWENAPCLQDWLASRWVPACLRETYRCW